MQSATYVTCVTCHTAHDRKEKIGFTSDARPPHERFEEANIKKAS